MRRELLGEVAKLAKDHTGAADHEFARGGRGCAAAGALEELSAEPLLDVFEHLARRRLRHIQPCGRLGDAALLAKGHDECELRQLQACLGQALGQRRPFRPRFS
jgi:hypothetical protein